MRRSLAAAAALAFVVLAPCAAADTLLEQCQVPAELASVDESLPRLAGRLAERPLVVAVVGSGSSAGSGVSARDRSYPAALQRELARRLPGVQVEVQTYARRGASAATQLEVIEREVIPRQPALVVWQTGTVDAVQRVDLNAFGETLQAGIAALHDKGIDVMLVDMQYGPQTDSLLQLRPYRNYMAWAARNLDAPIFRRYEIMQHWWENGTVDLAASGKAEQAKAADFVHDCIGRLLAAAIEGAVPEKGPR